MSSSKSLTVIPSDVGAYKNINGAAYPIHQSVVSFTQPNVVSIDASPAVPTAAMVDGTRYLFDFAPSQLQKVDSLCMRFDITESGGSAEMLLCDAAHFIEKMEWQSSLEASSVFYTAQGDSLWLEACILPDRTQQNAGYLRDLNVSENYGEGNTHTRSKTMSYRVALVGHPFEYSKNFLQQHKGMMRIVVTFRAGCIVSGSGVPRLDNLCLEFLQHQIGGADAALHAKLHAKMRAHRILEPQRLLITSKTLTAGTAATIDMDSFNGKFAFLAFGIRADSYAATSNGLIKFVDLGDEATYDLLDASGRSLTGKATRLSLLKNQVYAHHFDSEKFQSNRNIYIIPFCTSIKRAFGGSLQGGFRTFDGSKIKLQITPSAAGTACVQTINMNNPANDGGYYKLVFRGEMTNSLAYNADAAAIKAALEGLSTFKEYPGSPLTVTASGALTTDITLTFPSTLAPPQGAKDLVQVVSESLNDGTVADYNSTTCTTFGKAGFSTGSTYTVDIYGWKFRDLFYAGGQIRPSDT